jgi:tRNA pseudouridine32 synthase / 23S rRNA pseudouridine746 synthase
LIDLASLVLFENDDLFVINKPADLPVHAGSGGGETLEEYLPQLQRNKKNPPFLAHRLDRDTSGCLILGRNKPALARLGKLFETKRIHKTYWALTRGAPETGQGRIDLPLAKKTDKKYQWQMHVDETGQKAVTDFRVLATKNGVSWLELTPRTGRTHQLRVHCAAMGWPLIGDRFYGDDTVNPLMLHARRVSIPYTPNEADITVEAEPPAIFQAMKRDSGL